MREDAALHEIIAACTARCRCPARAVISVQRHPSGDPHRTAMACAVPAVLVTEVLGPSCIASFAVRRAGDIVPYKPCRATYVARRALALRARSLITSFGDRPVRCAKLDICRARRELSGAASTISCRPRGRRWRVELGARWQNQPRPPGPHLHSDVAVLAFATLRSPSALVALRA